MVAGFLFFVEWIDHGHTPKFRRGKLDIAEKPDKIAKYVNLL
jgi:hypothetical protein